MTFGMFILGVLVMAAGFGAVLKTDYLLRYFGDISEIFGAVNARWLGWKVLGVFLIVLGFLLAFDLFGPFFMVTLGRFISFGGTR